MWSLDRREVNGDSEMGNLQHGGDLIGFDERRVSFSKMMLKMKDQTWWGRGAFYMFGLIILAETKTDTGLR
jgi:hypothetical protein